jgi:hypothetical protein
MKKANVLMAFLCALGLLFASDAAAQRGMGPRSGAGLRGGGWCPGSQYMQMYNTQSIETITGEVASVDKITPYRGMSGGVHLTVKTANGMVPVHLGPAWYINNQEIELVKGDKITVKGSKIDFQGKPTIIASEVIKGDHVLKLRDENGFPAWSGWYRQQMMNQQK